MAQKSTEKSEIRKLYRRSIVFKSISGIVVMLIIFAVLIGYIGYSRFSETILEQYSEGALDTANTAATIVDGEDLYRYNQSDGDTGAYKKAFNELQVLCNSTGSAFIYVIQPDTSDYAHIRFVFSVSNYDMDFVPYEFGYLRETTNDEYREKYRSLYEQRTFSEIVVRDTGYIETDSHITALVPLRGSDNKVKGILCVQRQLAVLDSVRQKYINSIIAVLLILLLLAGIGQSMYLNRTLLVPLQKITDEARRFARENTRSDIRLTESIRNDDEIGMLANSIDRMEKRIQKYIEDITHITAERERIGAELKLANHIQTDMLPNRFPAYPDRTEFDVFASMTPAKEVGGDFYDFFSIGEDHMGFVIADVSGKGIPAALFMMLSKIIIKNQTLTGMGPAKILESVNEQICNTNREEMFVTVWLGILDLKTGLLRAANAGHEYPVLMQAGGNYELFRDKHGFVIGGIEDLTYTEYEIQMQKGSRLFVYTDGLTEAQNEAKEFFGIDRVVAVLNENRDLAPTELIGAMKDAVTEFSGGADQFDDLTMLCFEYCGE